MGEVGEGGEEGRGTEFRWWTRVGSMGEWKGGIVGQVAHEVGRVCGVRGWEERRRGGWVSEKGMKDGGRRIEGEGASWLGERCVGVLGGVRVGSGGGQGGVRVEERTEKSLR